MNQQVRVRFAPSPTGPLHIGGVRTALFNYLFAKKNNGKFILRIEDTDQNRYVEGAEQYIIDSLNWSGIVPDEGASYGGDFGPYRQSERKNIYKQYTDKLVKDGFAYYAFDTPEELEQLRKNLQEEKSHTQQYNFVTRDVMKNSLTMPESEIAEWIESGKPYVVRLKTPENEKIYLHDVVFGNITFNSCLLDDKILFKSDGMPTYHLANVVDDHLMKISHVIRGSEWINSTPIHILLYKYFGWENEIPEFAHTPLILKPTGKGKLSKRDGDKDGFPVFPLQWTNMETGEVSSGYRESGYFPEAFRNILVLLGWNPGGEQEIFSLEEMIGKFTLDRIGKSGARFDPEKAHWFNHHYLLEKSNTELAEIYLEIIHKKSHNPEISYVEEVVGLIKERANFVQDFWEQSFFFFERPTEYDPKIIKKRWKEHTPEILAQIIESLKNISSFIEEEIEKALKSYIENKELGFGQVLNPLRLTLVGSGKGPSLFKIIEMLGKDETIKRIETGIEKIKK